MYWGLVGMALALFLPAILAGLLSIAALKLAAHYYQMTIRWPLLEMGVVFGVAMYIYTVAFLATSPHGGSILGHLSANLVTTGVLAIHLNGAFAATHLTPEFPTLRTRPELAMSVAGVKAVTAIAIGIHVIIV